MKATTQEIIEVQQMRAETYRFFARLFLKPLTEKDLDAIAAGGIAGEKTGSAQIDHGMKMMANYLSRRNTGTCDQLNCDYTAAFYGVMTNDGRVAIPYESAFEDANQRYMGAARAKVFNIFKHCSLKLLEGVDLPDDHISFMCEFMAIMAERSIDELRQGNQVELAQNLAIQSAFLKTHINNWFPALVREADAILDQRFYKGALEAASAFFAEDEAILRDVEKATGAKDRSFALSDLEVGSCVQVKEERASKAQ